MDLSPERVTAHFALLANDPEGRSDGVIADCSEIVTIRSLAEEYDWTPSETAAALDLGCDYDETAAITSADEEWMREALDTIVADGDMREH